MDAIRKKMKSIKDETDQLYAIISKFENATKEAESISKEVSSISLKIMLYSIVSNHHHQRHNQHDRKLARLTVASATTVRRCTPSRWSWRRPSTS